MKRQLMAVALAVMFSGTMAWLNQQAIKQADSRPRHPNGPHPDQVDPVGPLSPECIKDMDAALRINGNYVVTTNSWRHME